MLGRKRQIRASIEHKFVWAIIWVGLIPMALAMAIGMISNLGSQQSLIQHSQLTAVEKTAEGVDMVLQGRRRSADLLSRDSEVLKVFRNGVPGQYSAILQRLKHEAANSGSLQSQFCLFDARGQFLTGTLTEGPDTRFLPEWIEETTGPRFVTSGELPSIRLLAPVKDETGQTTLGFISETQSLSDLIAFVLGGSSFSTEKNHYEVNYIGAGQDPEDIDRRAYLSRPLKGRPPEIILDSIESNLKDRLLHSGARRRGTLYLLRYKVQDRVFPVMLAYHQLETEPGLYIVAYRSLWDAFGGIGFSAILTLLTSGMAVVLFCLAGYRNVNNNIIRPLSLLNEGAQIIRHGDLELKLKIDTGDEIEELASSFNQMATALRGNLRQLGESEEKYRSLITSMRDGIYQADTNGAITFVNPVGAEIFGFSTPSDLIGADLRTLFIEEIDYVRLTGELNKHPFVEHTRVWMKKESPDMPRAICVEMSASRLFDSNGVMAGVEGTFRDVTQHVHLEQEARERSERIAAINQIANTINSSLEAGRVYEAICVEVRRLVHFDFASVTLLAVKNESAETRTLFPDPSISFPGTGGATGLCAAWVAREGRYLVVDELRPAAHGGERKISPFAEDFPPNIHSCLCVPLHATGRIIGSLNLGAIKPDSFSKHKVDAIGQITPHVAVAIRNARLLENLQQSLEEVTLAREKLHDANEELKTLDEMKTNLLSNVSHELRTPLVSVMGYTDMLLHGKVGPINEMQVEYLQISMRNVEKLVTLIENLLDFSRLHRGAEEMVFDTFDLADCARGSIQIIQPVADSRGIEVSLRTEKRAGLRGPGEDDETPGQVLVEGDKSKLTQVFNNLLSNAVKFNHNGGRVDVIITVGDDTVETVVRDSGIGIPEEEQDKVFTRFYQCDSSSTRKYGGTGIGLAIAQDIARLHGSRITVSSRPDEGSAFRFSLPLKRTATGKDSGSPVTPSPVETHLLVELVTQDRALSTQIRNILVSEGMDMIHAAYPSAAVSLATRYNPDCMLVDSESAPTFDIMLDELLAQPAASIAPMILLTNDDSLYARHRHVLAACVKRNFRKSTLLSGIHYALSRGVSSGPPLGERILCVDDDPEITTFMSRVLEAEGYQVDVCTSGEAALEVLTARNHWLVLLDIAMPGIDGWDVCERIKSDTGLSGIKVYFVTAKPISRNLPRLHEVGADGYIVKPFKAEELLGVVQGYEVHRPEEIAQAAESEEEA